MSVQDLIEYFDEEFPKEVSLDESWEPNLLAVPEQFHEEPTKFEDLISMEREEDETETSKKGDIY